MRTIRTRKDYRGSDKERVGVHEGKRPESKKKSVANGIYCSLRCHWTWFILFHSSTVRISSSDSCLTSCFTLSPSENVLFLFAHTSMVQMLLPSPYSNWFVVIPGFYFYVFWTRVRFFFFILFFFSFGFSTLRQNFHFADCAADVAGRCCISVELFASGKWFSFPSSLHPMQISCVSPPDQQILNGPFQPSQHMSSSMFRALWPPNQINVPCVDGNELNCANEVWPCAISEYTFRRDFSLPKAVYQFLLRVWVHMSIFSVRPFRRSMHSTNQIRCPLSFERFIAACLAWWFVTTSFVRVWLSSFREQKKATKICRHDMRRDNMWSWSCEVCTSRQSSHLGYTQ